MQQQVQPFEVLTGNTVAFNTVDLVARVEGFLTAIDYTDGGYVKKGDLQTILSLLPALQRPTISSLSDEEWVAVNTIIEEKTVRTLIPKLKAAGAQGIVEYPLNKIVL